MMMKCALMIQVDLLRSGESTFLLLDGDKDFQHTDRVQVAVVNLLPVPPIVRCLNDPGHQMIIRVLRRIATSN
jgi:hypothetical protein